MSTQTGFQKFKEWKHKLLQSRDLELPDGRSLYQYRLATAEFNELEALLRHWLGMFSVVDLGTITLVTGFPELFVLYASEWWRRRYDGSGFSWDPILHDLAVDPNGWTPGQRSDCVRDGLREWRLKPRENGALRFLAAVAVNGGLPLRLLAEAKGGLGRLLHSVLQSAKGQQVSRTQIYNWVESLQNSLPKSYRRETIYTLLTDIILVVLKLKQEAELSPSDDAIKVLNRKIPHWKQRFPLSMEDKMAQGLLEQLVKDAARVRVQKVKPRLPVERFLQQDLSGEWHLRSRIELPNILSIGALKQLFDIRDTELPRTAQLALGAGNNWLHTSIRRLAGQDIYRIESAIWGLEAASAMDEHILRLSAADGRSWSVEAQHGGVLDEELPWFFAAEEGDWRFLRQGSGNVAPDTAVVILPQGWQIIPVNSAQVQQIGQLKESVRPVLQIQGEVSLQRPDGYARQVHTGRPESKLEHFVWLGNRLWADFNNPSRAFLGMPSIYRIDEEGVKRRLEGRPGCSVMGAAHDSRPLGPVMLRYPAMGEAQLRTRSLLLPTGAKLKLELVNATRGKLHFRDWGVSTAKVINAEVQQKQQKTETGLTLEVAVASGQRTPEWLDLELGWPHTTYTTTMRVPFPASGVRAFDANGRELFSGSRLALQQLLGLRLVASLPDQAKAMDLQISAKEYGHSRRYPLNTAPGALSLEIAVLDYLSDIRQLLSTDDSPDARVLLSIWSEGQEIFKLKIARYAVLMERTENQVFLEEGGLEGVSIEQLEDLPVWAMRLEHPQDEPVPLMAKSSEGVASGVWDFEPEKREPGSWLIFPEQEASVLFRPLLWPVDGDIELKDELAAAINIPDSQIREDTIARIIDEMAADFLHSSWQKVEQLANQLGHLPLATLDLWRQFCHSPSGMVALVFRIGNLPNGFYLRFAQELPFAWELVSLRTWEQGIAELQRQSEALYGENGKPLFQLHLKAQREALWAECGALHFILGLASKNYDGEMARQTKFMPLVAAGAEKALFENSAESELMKLRHRHANAKWPVGLEDILADVHSTEDISSFLHVTEPGYIKAVVNMPLVAAATAASDQSGNFFFLPEHIHRLRTLKAFDQDWFDEAYNQTIARCFVGGFCRD